MLDRKSVPHLSIYKWVCCLIMVYHCALLYVLPAPQRLWAAFQSCTEAIMCVPQIVTYAVREKRIGAQRRANVNFGMTTYDASTGVAAVGKRHILGQSNVEQ